MQIVYHLGAHFTDEERLLKCLIANHELLQSEGVAVPDPKTYRGPLRDMAVRLKGRAASEDQQRDLLTQILGQAQLERLVLSWDSFLSLPPWVLKETMYPAAGERVQAFRQIFASHEVEFFLALRNPATLLPLLYQRNKPESYDMFLGGSDPYELRWSYVIARILELNPQVQLTVWCDEDTPLVWPEVLRAVAGLPADQPLVGENELLAMLMSGEGLARLQAYLDTRPPTSIEQRRKIVSAFLDKFALPERIDMAVEMPSWDQEMIDDLTAIYEEDVAKIAASGKVTFIQP
ncbi:MAG: hypothetical protein U5N55_12295 [Cypionkella sp.]|nr:hypothetical protein [Cypionkella sp.]